VRKRYKHSRDFLFEDVPDPTFVASVYMRKQKADRDRGDPLGFQPSGRTSHLVLVQRLVFSAVEKNTL
jgi:hypothetical protein